MARPSNMRQAFHEYGNTPLATIASISVENNVTNPPLLSERTMRTRSIGAFELMRTLMTDKLADGPYEKAAIGEMLARALANARRQGIVVPTLPTDESPQAVIPELALAPHACAPDEVDFPIPGIDDAVHA